MKDIESTIIDFFEESPHPEDQEIHALAEKLGIDKHEFEEIIYKINGESIVLINGVSIEKLAHSIIAYLEGKK